MAPVTGSVWSILVGYKIYEDDVVVGSRHTAQQISADGGDEENG